jgi:aminopeptidase N
MFGYATAQGTFSLAAHWYPILAGYDPVAGWVLSPPSRIGDPVFSNAALYDVGLTAPAGLILATSGREVGTADRSGRVRHRYVTGPARDFTIVGDNDFASLSEEVDGTTLTSYFDPTRPEGGREILREAAQSLALFNDLFGAYPYVELDLVEMPLRGAAGIEFPQLIYVDDNYYTRSAGEPGGTASVVAHEVAHQWWYGLVGNNQYAHAFTDEGLTNYVTAVYYEKVYGPERGQQEIDRMLKAPYFALLFGAGDQIVDRPTDEFRDGTYGVTIYCKAALGFGAIRAEIGDEAFFGALQSYAAEFQFGVATPDDLLTAFNQASGRDLSALWRHWFEAAEGRQDYDWADAMALLRELGR